MYVDVLTCVCVCVVWPGVAGRTSLAVRVGSGGKIAGEVSAPAPKGKKRKVSKNLANYRDKLDTLTDAEVCVG